MAEQRKTSQEHAAILLDVVFAVIITKPIEELPTLALSLNLSDPIPWADFSLKLSALIFCSFYWLETKGFLEDNLRLFTRADPNEYFNDRGVQGQLRFDLVGGLYLVCVASAVVAFSNSANLSKLVWFSAIFWIGDLLGTMGLRQRYGKFRSRIQTKEGLNSGAAGWWVGHIGSTFFIWYGVLNIAAYLAAIAGLHFLGNGEEVTVVVSIAVFALTMFRHFVWRSHLYCYFRDRLLREWRAGGVRG